MAKQKSRRPQIDWSSFSNNMKYATNAGTITLSNTSQDMAGDGVTISFTVSSACNALVTVSMGVQSSSDFEYRPEIRVGGSVIQTFSPSASTGGGRAPIRAFTTVIPLSTGANVLSAGVFLASAGTPNITAGGAVISAIVLGDVTA